MPSRAIRSAGCPGSACRRSRSRRCAPGQAADRADQRGLAHAVAPEQADHLAGTDRQVDTEQHLARAIGGLEPLHLQQRRGAPHGACALMLSSPPRRRDRRRPLPGRLRTAAGAPDAMTRAVDQHRDAVGQPEHGLDVVLDQQDGGRGRSRSISATIRSDSSGPVPASGSSSSSKSGRVASASPTSSARCSPCASWSARVPARCAAGRSRRAALRLVEERLLAAHRAPERQARAAARLHGKRKVVERRQRLEQPGDLVRAHQAAGDPLVRRQPGDVLALEQDPAAVRQQRARQLVDQAGLAGAVRAEQGVHLAGGDLERHVVGGVDAAEALRQRADATADSSSAASPLRARLGALRLAAADRRSAISPRGANSTTASRIQPT